MNKEHPISDEVLNLANIALSKGEYWMTYNKSLYFIDKNDVRFFPNETDEMNLQTIILAIVIYLMLCGLIPFPTYLKESPMGKNYQSK